MRENLTSGIDGGRLETGHCHGSPGSETHGKPCGKCTGRLQHIVLPRQSPTLHGKFYRTELDGLLRRINTYLVRWARRKFRRLRAFKKAKRWWNGLLRRQPALFAHWAWMTEF